MNFLRGILSIGIIIACTLNWIDVDTEMIMFSLSGLTWTSSNILIYISIFTAGYAFYNSYNKSNRNEWIYLISGLYGIVVTIFIYLSVYGFFDFIFTVLPKGETDGLIYDYGLGIYLTGFFSMILFLTSFSKSNNSENVNSFDQQKITTEKQSNLKFKGYEKIKTPNINEWKKNNPGKTINDYYSKYK